MLNDLKIEKLHEKNAVCWFMLIIARVLACFKSIFDSFVCSNCFMIRVVLWSYNDDRVMKKDKVDFKNWGVDEHTMLFI